MVTARDRDRMKRIGLAMAELNAQAVAESVARSPGENIEIGLRLGDAALAIAQNAVPRPDPVSPVSLWLARRRGVKPVR